MFLTLFLFLMLAVAIVLLFVMISELVTFLRTRVPFVPTSKADIEFIVKKLDITATDVFYDLGSGNGKVVFLVNKISGAECLGFELGWWTYLFSQVRSWLNNNSPAFGTPSFIKRGSGGVKFKNQNFFKADWSEANYIYGYLYPPLMGRVKEKFFQDCKPGSVAIIRDFPFPGLKANEVYYLPKSHEIYVYRKM